MTHHDPSDEPLPFLATPTTRRYAPAVRTHQGDARYEAILAAAYQLIKARGVGGLRVHDVAKAVGITNATLLYYFPTKAHLLQAVAAQVGQEFLQAGLRHANQGANADAITLLRDYFTSLTDQLQTAPDRFQVMTDLFLAAQRDPHLAEVLQVDAGWRAYLRDLLERGTQTEQFRTDLAYDEVISMIIAFCKGLPLIEAPTMLAAVVDQFYNCLLPQLLG